jgi:endonuclease YncB( thermonuclease family)
MAVAACWADVIMKDEYIRAVNVVRVIDGDTVVTDVDLGFYVTVRMSCRLTGINANEPNQPGGKEASAHLASLLSEATMVRVRSVRADKFAGRFDAIVVADYANGESIVVNDAMVASGFAVAWDGSGAKPVVPWPQAVAT